MFRSWEENRNKCNHRHGETHHQGFRQSYVSLTARAPSAARTRPPGASAARSARPPRLRVHGSRRAAAGRWRQAEAVSSERWTMHHWIPRMLSRKERASWRSWLGGSAVPGQRQAWVGAQGVSRQDLYKDRCGHVTAQAGAAMQLPARARRPEAAWPRHPGGQLCAHRWRPRRGLQAPVPCREGVHWGPRRAPLHHGIAPASDAAACCSVSSRLCTLQTGPAGSRACQTGMLLPDACQYCEK